MGTMTKAFSIHVPEILSDFMMEESETGNG